MPVGELIEVLQQSDLLSNLPREVLGPLAETAATEQYADGELIFDVGADDDTLYVIRSGAVEIRRSAQGDVLATLRAGKSFGELAAFDAQPRSAAAVARIDTELVGVTRDALTAVFRAEPAALMATVSNLARSLTMAKEQVTLVNQFLEEKVHERTEEVRGSRSPSIRLARQIALEHHERWDGRGYPSGLAGEEISLEARICSIADVFDALTSKRPYKQAWTFDDALAEIDTSTGSMFDPELARIFLSLEDELRDIHTQSLEGTLELRATDRALSDER